MHEMFFGFTTLRYVGDTPESLASDEPRDSATGKSSDGGVAGR